MKTRRRLKPITWLILSFSTLVALVTLWALFPIPIVMMSIKMTGVPSPAIETIYAPLDKIYLKEGTYYRWINIQRRWFTDDSDDPFHVDSDDPFHAGHDTWL